MMRGCQCDHNQYSETGSEMRAMVTVDCQLLCLEVIVSPERDSR
jgi:hypothetical protein